MDKTEASLWVFVVVCWAVMIGAVWYGGAYYVWPLYQQAEAAAKAGNFAEANYYQTKALGYVIWGLVVLYGFASRSDK